MNTGERVWFDAMEWTVEGPYTAPGNWGNEYVIERMGRRVAVRECDVERVRVMCSDGQTYWGDRP